MTKADFLNWLADMIENSGPSRLYRDVDVADVGVGTDGLDVTLVDGTSFSVDVFSR